MLEASFVACNHVLYVDSILVKHNYNKSTARNYMIEHTNKLKNLKLLNSLHSIFNRVEKRRKFSKFNFYS